MSTVSICIFVDIDGEFPWDYGDAEHHTTETSFKCTEVIDYIDTVESECRSWHNSLDER